MEQNEVKSQQPNNYQQSLQFSHNQTLKSLIQHPEQKILKSNQEASANVLILHEDKKLILPQKENQQIKKPNIINTQPKSIHVHSASQKNSQNNQENTWQEMSNMNLTGYRPKTQIHQKYLQRSKTMIQSQHKFEQSSQTFKHKLPPTILQYIASNARLNKLPESSVKKTQSGRKLGQLGLSKKLSMKYNKKRCQICDTEAPQKEFQKITKDCEHSYCASCLHQYVIYKINAFETVQCPYQGCDQKLNQDCQLYQQLPLQVRKKYKKLLQYEMTKQHPNRKLCPEEKCEGWIEIGQDFDPVCSVCKKIYCAKCLLPHHQGDCDNKQLQFFQGTLHYRQCNKCKNVIEKSSGCIHMTCRCGYQFCYLCGARWKHSHTCNNPQQQRLHRQEFQCCCCELQICDFDCDDCCDDCLNRFYDICCYCCDNDGDECCSCRCDCCCCDCCDCCDLDNCPGIRTLLGLLFRGLMFILWIVVVFPIVIIFDFMLMGMFWIVLTFISGMTMYTIEIISQLQGIWFPLSIIFYPLTAIVGVGLAFRQVFYEVYVSHVLQVAETLCQVFQDITND